MNRKLKALIDRLETSGEDFLWYLGQVPESKVHSAPASNQWTIHQIAAHMRDTERQAFLLRAERIKKLVHPAVESFDQESYSREHYDRNEPLRKIMSEFRLARRKLTRLMRGASAQEWNNWAVHPEFGKITLAWILQYNHSHTLEHEAEIAHRLATSLLQETNAADS